MEKEKRKRSRSDEKRQHIFDAAVIEFMENGYLAASMDKIAARANVSKRTVYNHFASKEILFEAIIERTLGDEEKLANFTFDPTRDLSEQLKAVALIYIEAITNDEYMNLSRVVVSEFVRNHETSQKAFEQYQTHDGGVVAFIQQAIDAGVLKIEDVTYATTQFLSLIKAFTYTPMLFAGYPLPSEDKLEGIVDDAITMFLKHYAVE